MDRLRPRTVPQGYSYHHWKSGRYENSMECMVNINFLFHLYFIDEDEGLVEKLRSILAQLEYSHEIKEWDKKGIPFSQFFYVPEVHPETSQHFLEREDEAHVFKVLLLSASLLSIYFYY